jgi:hypothetical protein
MTEYEQGLEDAARICEKMMHEGEWLAAEIRAFLRQDELDIDQWLEKK